jgi:hypothetical protein
MERIKKPLYWLCVVVIPGGELLLLYPWAKKQWNKRNKINKDVL